MKYIRFKENYIVSDYGDVWRITDDGLKLKKATKRKDGYYCIGINNKNCLLHRVVKEAFHGYSDLTVDHVDGNKNNNHLGNLEYVTMTENIKRAHCNGLVAKSNKMVVYKGGVYNSAKELSMLLNLNPAAVSQAIRGNWKVKGYYAKYI